MDKTIPFRISQKCLESVKLHAKRNGRTIRATAELLIAAALQSLEGVKKTKPI